MIPQVKVARPQKMGEVWRDEDTGRARRPGLSTTQILLGLIAFIVLLAVGAELLRDSNSPTLEAAIVSPHIGDRLPAGPIAIRLRTSAPPGRSSVWELAYTSPSAPEQWQILQKGIEAAQPSLTGSGRFFTELTEPGVYKVRLVASDDAGSGQVEDSVEFTIE
jgi:hypothetical protein